MVKLNQSHYFSATPRIPSVMFQALFGATTPKNCQSHEHLYSHPTFETNAIAYESFQIGEGLLCYLI